MLRTTRLYLRNLCHADVGTLFDYRNDSRCNLHQRYEDTTMAYLQTFVQDYSHSTFLSTEEEQHYAIARKEDGVMVGDASVFFTEKDNCFTLGITIAPIFWRQGYAFELLRALVEQLQKLEKTHTAYVHAMGIIELDAATAAPAADRAAAA